MIISPSILTANFSCISDELDRIKDDVQWVHLDVMDGNFVPNISFGPAVIKSIKKISNLFFDTHLMIKDPIKYIEDYVNAGSDLICFHIESDSDTEETIKKIKSFGKKVGLAISPDTDITAVFPYIDKVDMILIMSVYPGFGGQVFIEKTTDRIKAVHDYAKKINPTNSLLIQVDGGINSNTAKAVKKSGANVLVAGSYIFDSNCAKDAILSLL